MNNSSTKLPRVKQLIPATAKRAARETPGGSFAAIRHDGTHAPSGATSFQHSKENSSPTVSVIIPAYNVAPYISETLDSVFAQTFIKFEVILVNDGSLDTHELECALEPYANRLCYIKQENGGASVARNAGLRAARGKLVAFLDADDLWLPNYLEQQLKFFNEQDCDLVCADAMVFGDSPDAGRTYMSTVMRTAPPAGTVSFLDLVSAERSLITSGVIARRELIFEVGLFDEALRNAQDFDLWLRLARHGARLAYHRQVLLRYRGRLNSLTGDATNSLNRELRVLDKIERSYNLTPAESRSVAPVIRGRQAILQFELGKLFLARGDVELARGAFSTANNCRRTWKTQAVLWLSHLAPGAMKTLCLRRMRNETAKESLHAEVVGI
jgi:glycosyltransferase involved in cell wall biosynthesis